MAENTDTAGKVRLEFSPFDALGLAYGEDYTKKQIVAGWSASLCAVHPDKAGAYVHMWPTIENIKDAKAALLHGSKEELQKYQDFPQTDPRDHSIIIRNTHPNDYRQCCTCNMVVHRLAYVAHLDKHNRKLCIECQDELDVQDMAAHLAGHVPEPCHTCARMVQKRDMQAHYEEVHRVVCPYCPTRVMEWDMGAHIREYHFFCCPHCSRDVPVEDMVSHLNKYHPFFLCPVCDYKNIAAYCTSHLEDEHGWVPCPFCAAPVNPNGVVQHLTDYHGIRPCSECKPGDRDHLKHVHSSHRPLWSCPFCHELLAETSLAGHLEHAHSFQRCLTCARYSFRAAPGEFLDHISTVHHAEPCNECGAAIADGGLGHHVRVRHNLRQCSRCASLVPRPEWAAHELSHIQAECPFCKIPLSRDELTPHVAAAHACPFCPFTGLNPHDHIRSVHRHNVVPLSTGHPTVPAPEHTPRRHRRNKHRQASPPRETE